MLGLSSLKLKPRRVHIIGAGLSGLSCAVKLSEHNVTTILYEATAQAGGRCRSYKDKKLNKVIDNGNHLILRGNKASWKYISKLKTFGEFYTPAEKYVFHNATYKKQWYVKPPFIKDSWRSLSLLFANKQNVVSEYFNQNSRLYHEFVSPLCLAALNTHPNDSSAKIMRNILLRMLVPGQADYLQIRTNFNSALIEPAIKTASEARFNKRLNKIELTDNRITKLHFSDETIQKIRQDERVVLATPPDITANLLPSLNIPEFEYNTIINGHFIIDTDDISPRLLGVIDSPLHWIFLKDGILSTTTSNSEVSALHNKENIADIIWKEVGKCYSSLKNKPIPENRIIIEKRATIAANPDNIAKRPKAENNIKNLTLAGDWLHSPLPACIESSIKSGNKAALWCLKQSAQ